MESVEKKDLKYQCTPLDMNLKAFIKGASLIVLTGHYSALFSQNATESTLSTLTTLADVIFGYCI